MAMSCDGAQRAGGEGNGKGKKRSRKGKVRRSGLEAGSRRCAVPWHQVGEGAKEEGGKRSRKAKAGVGGGMRKEGDGLSGAPGKWGGLEGGQGNGLRDKWSRKGKVRRGGLKGGRKGCRQ